MNTLLQYTGSVLNREDHLRRDEEKIESLWGESSTQVVLVVDLKYLVDESCNAFMSTPVEIDRAVTEYHHRTFLGISAGIAFFSVECSEAAVQSLLDCSKKLRLADLRQIGPQLSQEQASILAFSRGLSHWHQQNRYCSSCGEVLELINAGHVLRCSASECAKQWFPRTDPAVIMLVEKTNAAGERQCLLGRSPAWPDKVFSTLAGFVETGETLEQAVAREVFEEAAIVVENVKYVTSQPWPFPQSIMLGFVATATTEEITIDTQELAQACWFSTSEVANFGQWGDDSDGCKLPRSDSIARFLIDQWLHADK